MYVYCNTCTCVLQGNVHMYTCTYTCTYSSTGIAIACHRTSTGIVRDTRPRNVPVLEYVSRHVFREFNSSKASLPEVDPRARVVSLYQYQYLPVRYRYQYRGKVRVPIPVVDHAVLYVFSIHVYTYMCTGTRVLTVQ